MTETGPVTVLPVSFVGGAHGPWRVTASTAVVGEGLAGAERLAVHEGPGPDGAGAVWTLRGVVSHARYVTAAESRALAARSPALGRDGATRAALIPVRKSPRWWALAQDERREILEERSRHVTLGMRSLPAVARRLHHGRDLGEPFDFLTWFEFAPADAAGFEDLVSALRATPEWDYVDREVDVRLER